MGLREVRKRGNQPFQRKVKEFQVRDSKTAVQLNLYHLKCVLRVVASETEQGWNNYKREKKGEG